MIKGCKSTSLVVIKPRMTASPLVAGIETDQPDIFLAGRSAKSLIHSHFQLGGRRRFAAVNDLRWRRRCCCPQSREIRRAVPPRGLSPPATLPFPRARPGTSEG